MATLSPTPPGGVSADNFFGRQWTARTGLWLQRQTTLARRRLGWRKLTENDHRLQALKNRHRGERAFLIGNGPSLRVSDLDQLCGEITFAANKIFLAFPETRWRPTYYHVSDTLVAYNNAPRIRALETPCNLFADCCQPWLGDCQATWLYEKPRRLWDPFAKRCRFSRNLLHGVDGGGTVIYHQLQVAWMMGIREIYLIGLDFDFKLPSQPSGLHCPQGQVLVGQAKRG